PLVDALRSIGASISYLEKEGYPPLAIDSPQDMTAVREVHINAGISSQYITALILIAPTLPNGLTIHLEGEMVSESYLMMTIKTVEEFGIQVQYDGKTLSIPPQRYQSTAYTVEADWSAASYYYSLIALAKSGSRIELQGLFENSTQGDATISSFGEQFGVSTTWEGDTCILTKVKGQSSLTYDFINQPDIAQTLAVICSAKAIRSDFTGLRTLRIKETDRIYAVDQELGKVGGSFRHAMTDPTGEEHYSTDPISWDGAIPRFETYKDHRMAMAFAPLALLSPIEINKPEVVSKSYPEFWDHLEELGFLIDRIHG
ncbi:MAG: 3-phosphoshikimate 1-carboxyvinyltransferase, partial [Bacteroidota bacterium]